MKTYLYQVNVTRDCNLRCTHCYIHSDVKKASKEMQGDQILSIARQIVEHMQSIRYDRAEIHIIGGEPTMLGFEFFEKHIPLIREILEGHGFSYELLLVSNLLNDRVVDIARLFDRVTTSYEPETRFTKEKLEQRWIDAVKALQDAGINVGVTTAITKPVVDFGARRLLDWFYEKRIKNIHLGFFIPSGDGFVNKAQVFPQFHETSEFLIEAAKWQIEKRDIDPDLWVNPFESMLAAVSTNTPLDDIVCPIISGSMDVNWDGNAVTCLEKGGELGVQWQGNIFESSIKSVAASKGFMEAVVKARRPKSVCVTCDEYQSCRSGCGVLFDYWDPNLDQDCPGFKKFIKFVRHSYEIGVKPRYTEYAPKGC
jgi:radical SAM protein with 4Fe4S-binding SPASM domain